MRKKFPGFYRLTEEAFEALWDDCIFVFDTNMLLNFYRYSPELSDSLLAILQSNRIADRLWIPYHVGWEYQHHRLNTISQQRDNYESTRNGIQEALRNIKEPFEKESHPYIQDQKRLLQTVEEALSDIEQALDAHKQDIPNINDDPWHDRLSDLFAGQVGEPYSLEQMQDIFKEGKKRYDAEVPPGYKDKKKSPNRRRYGDLIVWKQMLDKAGESKNPILFVTDDSKEDWWWQHRGKRIGPRPELIQEMYEIADVQFYMYSGGPFIRYAQEYLEQEIDQEAVEEADRVTENLRRSYEVQQLLTQTISASQFQTFDSANRALSARQQEIDEAIQALASSDQLQIFDRAARAFLARQQEIDEAVQALAASGQLQTLDRATRAFSARQQEIDKAVQALAASGQRQVIDRIIEQATSPSGILQAAIEKSESNITKHLGEAEQDENSNDE